MRWLRERPDPQGPSSRREGFASYWFILEHVSDERLRVRTIIRSPPAITVHSNSVTANVNDNFT